jgi:hypothetical protein
MQDEQTQSTTFCSNPKLELEWSCYVKWSCYAKWNDNVTDATTNPITISSYHATLNDVTTTNDAIIRLNDVVTINGTSNVLIIATNDVNAIKIIIKTMRITILLHACL